MGTSVKDYGEFFFGYVQNRGGFPLVFADEPPHFLVSLPTFSIDQLEATNARYRRCVEAGACPLSSPYYYNIPDDYATNPTYDDYPVLVTGLAAQAYCQWVGKRLLTEAEWAKAARGTDGRIYPWGNEWDANKVAMEMEPVGSHPDGASPYGALDMVGNASEWTGSQYELYPGTAELNPDLFHILADELAAYRWVVRGCPNLDTPISL